MTMIECPYCEGCGEVLDRARITSQSISPPHRTCPVCNGTGEIDEEEADDVDLDKSAEEYYQDNKQYHDECRWEEKEDIDRYGY